jgi:pilus assembly protein Flp/PilA
MVGNASELDRSQARAAVLRFVKFENGAALIEYGLLLMLIALLCIVAVQSMGTKVSKGFTSADNLLP